MTTTKTDFTAMANRLDVIVPELLATSGHSQVVVRCTRCGELHRHCGLGLRRSPCGQIYYLSTTPETALSAA